MCLGEGKPSPCGEDILSLFHAAGKPVLSIVEGMPAGRKAGTASPRTTIGMRLPPSKINMKRVAASKPEALGMVANAKGSYTHNHGQI